jgi:iron complex outermembrane receptor protein
LANIPADRITPTLDFEKKYRKNDYANTWHIINFRISTPLVNRQYKAPIEYGFVKSPSKYALLNLAAIYTYFHEKGSVSFSANVDNVMNTNYRDYMNRYRYFVNEIGRSIYFKVNVVF